MGFTYRGLKAHLDRHLVTEEEVNHHLQRLREQNPRVAVVQDRPAELGDEVVLDYKGYCDGVQFAGGTAENQTLVLGSGMFIPGFEEQLVDKVPEEPVVEPIEEVVEQPQEIVEPKTLYEPLLNVHTNLLYDLGTAVNIGVEYYPRNSRWTIAANYTFPWWSKDKNHRYLQLIDGELEVRRYFDKDASYTGHYLAFYGHGNYYDFSFDSEKAWQGEGAGLGFTYGYVWQPWKNQHWKLDAFIRFGYYQSLYDPYHASNPYNGKYYYDWEGAVEDFERRNHRLRWFGPTGLGLKLSYDLNWRKVRQ